MVGPDEYEGAEPDPLLDAALGVLAHLAWASIARNSGPASAPMDLPGVEFVEPRCPGPVRVGVAGGQ